MRFGCRLTLPFVLHLLFPLIMAKKKSSQASASKKNDESSATTSDAAAVAEATPAAAVAEEEEEMELLQVELGDMVKMKQVLDEAVIAAVTETLEEE